MLLLLLLNCRFFPFKCSGSHIRSWFCGVNSLFFFLVSLSFSSLGLCCIEDERDSLLSFISDLSSVPPSSLPRWKLQHDRNCCNWEGLSCNGEGSISRLWLPHRGLEGNIHPSLAGLKQLTQLNLSHNSLSGTLSSEILLSGSLVVVDVSSNRLSGRLLDITASTMINGQLKLQSLNLSNNLFDGTFPPIWAFATGLAELDGSINRFSGAINSSICSLANRLRFLDFSHNQLDGNVPRGLGNCSELSEFRAGFNNLSGPLPRDLYNAVSLQKLSLQFNQISGTLDARLMIRLSKLRLLDLSGNRLRGELPKAIGKLANLEELVIYSNNLSGNLPMALGNCTRLKYLNLRENNFTGLLSRFDFSTLSDLKTLDLGNNNFTGNIPDSLYSCKSLVAFRLANNSLQGQIAPGIANLQALSYISLSKNEIHNISGALKILENCRNLTTIVLSTNFQGENVPVGLGKNDNIFPNLRVLALGNCQLKGPLPPWLAMLGKLEVLDMSLNQLTGLVPDWLGSLPHLFYLDLSENRLSGKFPLKLASMRALTYEQVAANLNKNFLELPVFASFGVNTLNLQYNKLASLHPAILLRDNKLSGSIPQEIGNLKVLHGLDLSQNNFSGGIPVELCKLTNLELLNLSRNNLSGEIPQELSKLHFLSFFSVAHNHLQGKIPVGPQFDSFQESSFEGNPGLFCGSHLQHECTNLLNHTADRVSTSKHPNNKIIIFASLATCFGGAVVLTLFIRCTLSKVRSKHLRHQREFSEKEKQPNNMIPSFSDVDNNASVVLFPKNCSSLKKLTISDILKGTDNFSQEQIVGCGGFGLVYKAILPDGTKLAVKRLSGDMGIMDREFRAEVEALSNAKHRNLVTLQGYCMYGGFHLLIYSFMENGSLDYWLHEREDGKHVLNWPIRLRIAQGTSQGLSYIHQICQPHIVHRDIKSSNILLDLDLEAHVADFGLSRLMRPTDTHVSTELVGTLGYIPPEYAQALIATPRGDIYSFGVVLLELLTGRRPLEFFKPKQSQELVGWVQQMQSQGKQMDVFDTLLGGKEFEEQMLHVLKIACLCVDQDPLKRPTIKEVVDWLDIVANNLPSS